MTTLEHNGEKNIIAKDFEKIFSLKNDPTTRNYMKTAERVVSSLTDQNWHSPLLIKDVIAQLEKSVVECKKIQEEKDPLIAGYDIMAKIGNLEGNLNDFIGKLKKANFRTLDELKAEFQTQKDAAEEIAKSVTEEDREMVA